MERAQRRLQKVLTLSVLALTLIAPWALGQESVAVTEIRRRAELGDAEAQYELGRMYGLGRGVQADDAEAVKWYRKAAEQGDVRGQYKLGQRYDYGEGVQADDAEAVKWYRKAAEQGDVDAQYRLGRMYAHGEGVPESDDAAVEWLGKAGERWADRLFLMYAYGDGLPKNHTEAMKWFRRAAEQSYVGALYHSNLMRAYGEIVPEDLEDRDEWRRKAANVRFNFDAAVRWFRTVAEHARADSRREESSFNLCVIYDIGLGVPEDKAEAARWLRKAGGDSLITPFQLYNWVGWQNDALIVKWLSWVAELGFADSQVAIALADKYANGEGVPKNGTEALKWYRNAAEQGNAWDQFRLGSMLSNGEGVPKNDAEAVKWYRMAAEQGLFPAQYNLGLMYAKGGGVPKDYVRAYAWFNLAAAKGDTSAAEIRDEFQSSMTTDQTARAQELSATLFNRINQSR